MNDLQPLRNDIELHDADSLGARLARGLDPNILVDGKNLLERLVSEYTRSPRFTRCVKVLLEGGVPADPVLAALLQDDAQALGVQLEADEKIIGRKYNFDCVYTPLREATLLHVCAEFNLTTCGALLLKMGIDVDTPAGVDEWGFGGQTPVFHTVNQNQHQSKEMLALLLQHKCRVDVTVKGLIWGKGYPWETLVPSVNPISYALMGLLPQMHRNEQTIHQTVQQLMRHAYGVDHPLFNVPCRYLRG